MCVSLWVRMCLRTVFNHINGNGNYRKKQWKYCLIVFRTLLYGIEAKRCRSCKCTQRGFYILRAWICVVNHTKTRSAMARCQFTYIFVVCLAVFGLVLLDGRGSRGRKKYIYLLSKNRGQDTYLVDRDDCRSLLLCMHDGGPRPLYCQHSTHFIDHDIHGLGLSHNH